MASPEIKRLRRKAFIAVFVIVAGTFGTLAIAPPPVFEDLENRSWDWRMRAVAQPPSESPVRIINIDQASLDYLAEQEKIFWPWPRSIYEVVLRYLQQAGAKSVGFDVLFTEQSIYGVEDDDAFAAVVAETLPVVSAVATREEPTQESKEDLNSFLQKQKESEATISRISLPVSSVSSFDGITLPVSSLLKNSAMLGDVKGLPDQDGVFRHIVPVASYSGTYIPRMPFALFALTYPENRIGLESLLTSSNKIPIRFYGPKRSFDTESFANIFISWQNIMAGKDPAIPLERYRDSIVLVGMDAPGLLDLRPTPLSPNFPGVELNATVVQNIMDHSFIKMLSDRKVLLLILILTALVTSVGLYSSGLLQSFLIISLLLGYSSLSFLAAFNGWWIPLAIPAIAIITAAALCLTIQYLIEGRQYRMIRNAFRFYVSPAVIDRIVEDPSQLRLGGEKRELTIFFSDIVGFTTISETLQADKLVTMLNSYLTAITDIILESGGTVDKYVGDAVVAFWNAPVTIDDHALRGVKVALEIQEVLTKLNEGYKKEYGVSVETRIGLNTGTVSVGNFGSSARFNYTVVGDAANLASRLEGANKYFGTRVMIAESTLNLLNGAVPCRKIGTLKVVGKNAGVTVYEPLSKNDPLRIAENATRYEEGVLLFEAGNLTEAKEELSLLESDPVSKCYLARIDKELLSLKDGTTFNPMWNLSSK